MTILFVYTIPKVNAISISLGPCRVAKADGGPLYAVDGAVLKAIFSDIHR